MRSTEADPRTGYTVDLEIKTLTYGERRIPFDLPETYRSALTSGSWDSTSMLRGNLEKVKEVASGLPYVTGFKAPV